MSRHPLRRRAILVALVAEAVIVAAALGVPADVLDTVHVVAMSLVNVAVLVGLVASGEPEVTPVSDPRDREGRPLVPVVE